MDIYNQYESNLRSYWKEIQETERKIDNLVPLNKWTLVPIGFPQEIILLEHFHISGIYILYSDNEIFYIGISKKIGLRILQHLENYDDSITKIKVKKFKDWKLAELTEKELIYRIKPKNNKQIVSRNIIRFNRRKWQECIDNGEISID